MLGPADYMTVVRDAVTDAISAFAPLLVLAIGAIVAFYLSRLALSLLSGRSADPGGGKRVQTSAAMPRKGVFR